MFYVSLSFHITFYEVIVRALTFPNMNTVSNTFYENIQKL